MGNHSRNPIIQSKIHDVRSTSNRIQIFVNYLNSNEGSSNEIFNITLICVKRGDIIGNADSAL